MKTGTIGFLLDNIVVIVVLIVLVVIGLFIMEKYKLMEVKDENIGDGSHELPKRNDFIFNNDVKNALIGGSVLFVLLLGIYLIKS